MHFKKHSDLEGKHAFLSASKYSWLRYDSDKLINSYYTERQKHLGTQLHEFAAEAIKLGVRLPRTKETLNMFVNDAIGYRMTPEQPLAFSDNAFGTADAISFRKNLLRIHDLKTGVTPASFDQLMIYAAFFCHEYHFKPADIKVELRLYQNNDVRIHIPELPELVHVYEHVKWADSVIESLKIEED